MTLQLLFCGMLLAWFVQKNTVFLSSSHLAFPLGVLLVQMEQLYSGTDTATTWKKFPFILSEMPDFHWNDNMSIAVHAFPIFMLISLSVDEILLPRYVNRSIEFRGLSLKVEIAPFYLKGINSVLPAFMQRPMPLAAFSWLCSSDSALSGVFSRSAISSALSTSLVVSAWHRLPLVFFNVKSFSFNWSFDVCST